MPLLSKECTRQFANRSQGKKHPNPYAFWSKIVTIVSVFLSVELYFHPFFFMKTADSPQWQFSMRKKNRRIQESWDDEETEEVIIVSKSELKRDMDELKSIGSRLMELKPALLDKLPLNARLRAALDESRRINSHNAIKRHLGFIGKLLADQDIEPVMALLNQLDSSSDEYNCRFHQLERWRDQLIHDDDNHAALTLYLEQYPEADHQHIRQLVRNAQKEAAQDKPPAAARKLFKYLREIGEL